MIQLPNNFIAVEIPEDATNFSIWISQFNLKGLKKGREYSDNPDDYLQLCPSCHRKYDFSEKIRGKLKAKKLGELHNFAKLSQADVIEIYKRIVDGEMNKDIAASYNVDSSTISDIKRGKRWPHIYHIFKAIKIEKQ